MQWSRLCLLATLIPAACTESPDIAGTVYYVCKVGNDALSGDSEASAWRSIERVNRADLGPGDVILFRGGEEFAGTLRFTKQDSGAPLGRVRCSSYGEGTATINGGEEEGLIADSCHFLTIDRLRFTGSGRLTGNSSDGVLINRCDSVLLDRLEVEGFQHSGIHLHHCDDARIMHINAHENGFAGIHVTGDSWVDPEQYGNHRLYIGYCLAWNNPGDPTVTDNHSGNGILASSVEQGTIEFCEAYNNGWDMPWTGNGPVGIWIWDCTGFTIQCCISHHNRTNPAAADGGGFDLDGGVSHSVIRYCISHHNEGAGFGLYEFGAVKPWQENTLRYNLSLNDGAVNAASVGIWKNEAGGSMKNCLLRNNIFYNSLDSGSNLWLYDHYPGFSFRNNIFVFNGSLVAEGQGITNEEFRGNIYWDLARKLCSVKL